MYKGLNIATGELFALKEIEIHSSPNDDQVTQLQKLGEEIGLMNNLSHKHIVRSVEHFFLSCLSCTNILVLLGAQLRGKSPIREPFLHFHGVRARWVDCQVRASRYYM